MLLVSSNSSGALSLRSTLASLSFTRVFL